MTFCWNCEADVDLLTLTFPFCCKSCENEYDGHVDDLWDEEAYEREDWQADSDWLDNDDWDDDDLDDFYDEDDL